MGHRRFQLPDLLLKFPLRKVSMSLRMHGPGSEYPALECCTTELVWATVQATEGFSSPLFLVQVLNRQALRPSQEDGSDMYVPPTVYSQGKGPGGKVISLGYLWSDQVSSP